MTNPGAAIDQPELRIQPRAHRVSKACPKRLPDQENGLSTIKPGGMATAQSRNGTDQGGSPVPNPGAAIKGPEARA
ncbi:hypothetical protein AU467_33440 [Mesorhizobium loti]|uniref:Uncharacterized protein n=1 Tax=Rhizobium loti TaxID=381 RepID=A0A117N1G3_RHILI|nr:hypothetical protein AU467_33440 [Mesorhizobium loti]